MVSSISGLFIQSNNCVLMSTEVIEEYATQYQDCLKSQDASHSAAFRSSILLHRPLSLDVAFPSIYNVTFPRIDSSRSL